MAERAHTTPTPTRRTLGAGLFATVVGSTLTAGIAGGLAASVDDLVPAEPDATPIITASRRLAALGALDETDERLAEEIEIADLLTDSAPATLADAVILLMVATAEIKSDDLYDDGVYGHERGNVLVRRVTTFLAGLSGVDLAQHGGSFFLTRPDVEALALAGTVEEAARRFYDVGEAERESRHAEYRLLLRRQIALAPRAEGQFVDEFRRLTQQWSDARKGAS